MYGWCYDQPCCCSEGTRCFFEDDFAGHKRCYQKHEFDGSSTAPNFTVTGGRLNLSNGSPVASGSYFRPTILSDGDSIHVEAGVYSITGADKTGIFIGDAVAFVANWSSGQLERYDVDEFGEATGSATAFSTVTSGDTLLLSISAGSSAGLYDIEFSKNDVVVRTETDASLNLGDINDDWRAGMLAIEGGEWEFFNTFCEESSIPLCTLQECSICPDDTTVQEWLFSMSGVTNGTCNQSASYNGDFAMTCFTTPDCFWSTAGLFAPTCNGSAANHCSLTIYGLRLESGVMRLTARISVNVSESPRPPCRSIATWDIPEEEFDCLGENVLTLNSSLTTGEYTNWPSTVTITPWDGT